jgi:hypothetical protein
MFNRGKDGSNAKRSCTICDEVLSLSFSAPSLYYSASVECEKNDPRMTVQISDWYLHEVRT